MYHGYGDDGCMFCTGVSESQQSHQRDKCPEFCALKKKTSYKPYVKAKLSDQDEQGFAAAGFLLWKKESEKLQVLMARECREDGDLLNFPGGKRLRKTESAIEVALKKVNMESGRKLSRDALEGMKHAPLVHWSGRSKSASKYALFLYEVTLGPDCKVDVLAARVEDEGVKKLEWVSCENLKTPSFINGQLHSFVKEMFQASSDPTCDVLASIEELSETANTAGEASDVTDDTQEKVPSDLDAKLSEMKL